jgi:hypothetical protein
MTAQYSILKITLNELLGDEVSVGLFIDTGKALWFEYSEEELSKTKKLIPNGAENLETVIKTIKASISARHSEDFSPIQVFMNKDYSSLLYHLSSTYNNLIKITKPKPVNINQFSETEYVKFYNELFKISPLIPAKPEKHESRRVISEKLIKPLKGVVHTEVVMSKVFPELYFSTKVDCIGKNGSYIAAKHLDFEMSVQTVDTHFNHYNFLLDYIERNQEENCTAFILASPPPSNAHLTIHKMWDFMNNDNRFTIKPPEQSSDVVEYVFKTKATKFANDELLEEQSE